MHKNILSNTLQRRSSKKWSFNRETTFKISAYFGLKKTICQINLVSKLW